MGLPSLSNSTVPHCSGLPGTRPCTSTDIIDYVNRRQPVYMPGTSPVYSNIGFAILGMVIEAVTGKSFDDVVKSDIFEVAGLGSTSFNGPDESFLEAGFIPFGESTWNVTLGVFEALVWRFPLETTWLTDKCWWHVFQYRRHAGVLRGDPEESVAYSRSNEGVDETNLAHILSWVLGRCTLGDTPQQQLDRR